MNNTWQSFGVKTVTETPQGRRWSDGTAATSCLQYLNPPAGHLYTGSIGNGTYLIDVDGDASLPQTPVVCDMSGGGWTVFHHNKEVRFRSIGFEAPRSAQYPLVYNAPIAVILAAKAAASNVEQYIKKECLGSLIADSIAYTAWVYPTGGVAPASAWPNRAQCDLNDGVWRESSGIVTNASYLPMTRIDAGDTGDANEDSYFTVGPFRVK